MEYSALDIARYIIGVCTNARKSISNLQLQKILYFVQGEYFKKTGELLFDEDFLAWQLGPVVQSVYDQYCVYGGSKIYDDELPNIEQCVSDIIDPVILRRSKQTAWKLVNDAHKDGGAWKLSYNGNKSTVIKKSLIEREFRGN